MLNCPNCRSEDDHEVVWGPTNWWIAVRNALVYLVWTTIVLLVIVPPSDVPGRPLKRKCLGCGYRFYGPTPEAPDFDACAKCGYSLIGNISGRCPECGWRLPLRFRRHRRAKDHPRRSIFKRRRLRCDEEKDRADEEDNY